MAHDVFISYSSIDKAVADTIVAEFEQKNIRCWYAPRDIEPGGDWAQAIAKAIKESSIFLLIFSSNSNKSQRVLDELNMAISMENVILPFRIENLDPSGAMSLHLSSRHWLDAFRPSWEKHINNLVKSVEALINKEGDKFFDEKNKADRQKKGFTKAARVIVPLLVLILAGWFFYPKIFDVGYEQDTAAPTATQEAAVPTEVDLPTSTPEEPSLGSADNQIIWMYVPPPDLPFNDVSTAAEEIVRLFEEVSGGLIVKALPAPNTSSIVDALCEGAAHLGSLGAFSYIAVSERGCAESRLIWSAHEDIAYGGMIFTNSELGLTDISDFEGQALCIPDFTSNSGWWLPSLELKSRVGELETFFGEIIEAGGHDIAVEAVYSGDCALGTAFYDARNLVEHEDVNEIVSILEITTTIPNMSISFHTDFDNEISNSIINTLIELSTMSDDLSYVSGYSGSESIQQLIEINDFYYEEFRNLIFGAGEDPLDYLEENILN